MRSWLNMRIEAELAACFDAYYYTWLITLILVLALVVRVQWMSLTFQFEALLMRRFCMALEVEKEISSISFS